MKELKWAEKLLQWANNLEDASRWNHWAPLGAQYDAVSLAAQFQGCSLYSEFKKRVEQEVVRSFWWRREMEAEDAGPIHGMSALPFTPRQKYYLTPEDFNY